MDSLKRLFDIPLYLKDKHNLGIVLNSKSSGKWIHISSKKYFGMSNQLSRGLLKLNVRKGDKIGVISTNNRYEWNILDIAIQQIGAVNVPIYPNMASHDYDYIFNHSEIKVCFISDVDVYKRIKPITERSKCIEKIYAFDKVEGCTSWEEILDLGLDAGNQKELEDLKASILTDDLATIIYTSGTSGTPKGVMLSHNNIISNVLGIKKRLPLSGGSKALSFLPLCHSYERMVNYLFQYGQLNVYYAESFDKIGDNIREIGPEIMTVVPRLLEKVYEKVRDKGFALKGLKRIIFNLVLQFANQYDIEKTNHLLYRIRHGLAKKLVLGKIYQSLGGHLKYIVSGSAPLDLELFNFFSSLGITILEGYGLSETSPVISVTDFKRKTKVGTVGTILENLDVKIAADGEILCKGPSVMMGYYKDEKLTKEVLKNGYFHTGDIGVLDKDNYLKIIDRKKEMYKTSGGKYISPQYIENKLKRHPLIEHAMVLGDNKKMVTAFVVLNFNYVKNWATKKKILPNPNANINLEHKQIIAKTQGVIDMCNQSLAKYETIRKFKIIPDQWGVESGELTPTLKLKRRYILEKYKHFYHTMYD